LEQVLNIDQTQPSKNAYIASSLCSTMTGHKFRTTPKTKLQFKRTDQKFTRTPKAKLQFKWSDMKLAANSDFGKQQASNDMTRCNSK